VQTIGRFRTISLLGRLLQFMVGFIWVSQVRRQPPAQVAARLRTFLEEMGGLWIKAGQLVSLRLDVLTPEMADEMSQLQYHTFGFSPEIARGVIEAQLGRPIEEVFDIFEERPFAAASISQVHRARLRHNAVWVVIKVQRPGIDALFERDIRILVGLLRLVGKMPQVSYIDWDIMSRELQRIVREEIDYRYEAAHLRRMRKSLRHHNIYVPKLFRKYSGPNIIVMEEIKGPLMSDYLTIERKDPARLQTWLTENNIKPRKVGSRLVRSFYRQLLEDNYFHSDLHPGNIILLRNSRLALIDLGAAGSVDKQFLDVYKHLSIEITMGNYNKGLDYLLMMADKLELLDVGAFKTEMIEAYRNWEARSHLQGASYRDRSVLGSDLAADSARLSAKYRVGSSWQFLRITRAFSTMDASLAALMGNSSPNKVLNKYFRQAQRRSWKRFRKRGIAKMAVNATTELQVGSTFVSDMLRQSAVRFQGVQSNLNHLSAVISGIFRWALFFLGLFVLYDLLHQHAFNVVAGLHPQLGAFGRLAEQIPAYPIEVALFFLIIIILLYRTVGKLKQRFSQPTVRLPGGRLDS
jgi:ubiquinone biosynthesis protein